MPSWAHYTAVSKKDDFLSVPFLFYSSRSPLVNSWKWTAVIVIVEGNVLLVYQASFPSVAVTDRVPPPLMGQKFKAKRIEFFWGPQTWFLDLYLGLGLNGWKHFWSPTLELSLDPPLERWFPQECQCIYLQGDRYHSRCSLNTQSLVKKKCHWIVIIIFIRMQVHFTLL